MEHDVCPQRRTEDKKKPSPGHHSPFEERVEGLLRFQGEQVQGSGTTAPPDSRRKRGREWSQVRRPDSCNMDSLLSWLPDIFRCGRQIQLCQVLQGPSFTRGMDQHRGWPAAQRIRNDLLRLHRRGQSVLHQKHATLRIWERPGLRIKQMVQASQWLHQEPPYSEHKWR